MDQSTPKAPSLGYFSQRQELPSVTPAWLESEERLKRERETSAADYAGSMFRQDGLVDGIVATYVGRQMAPDAAYSPFEANEWKSLTEGIWPEYHSAFSEAHSGAHALFIKDRLLDKQRDLTRLGDLGVPGTIGRFALAAVSPDNLLAGVLSGGVSRFTQAARAARLAAGVVPNRALSVAAGVAGGAASEAAFEKLRQSVNFEDDNTAVLESALIGAAFTSPFAVAGARSEARIAQAAAKEREVLTALAKVDAGEELAPHEARSVQDLIAAHKVVEEVEAGRMSPAEGARKLAGEDQQWLDNLHGELRTRAETMLDEMFPSRVTERTRQQFVPDDQPLLLEHDPNVGAGRAPIQVTPGGLAAPGAVTKADVERMIREAATKRFPKDPAKAEAWAMEQRAASLGYRTEVATKVAAAKAAKNPGEVIAGDKPAEAPASPVKAPNEAAPAQPLTSAPEAPAAPVKARPQVGQSVDFTHPRTGEVMWGDIEEIRDNGYYAIRDEDGKLHVVHPARLQDQPNPFGPDSIGAARVANAAGSTESQVTRLSNVRLDIFAVLNRSKSDKVRELAYLLVKDAIQNDAKYAQGMTATEWKAQIKRTVGGLFHKDSREAAREAADVMQVPLWKRAGFYHEFHSMVSRLTRGDLSVTVTNPTIAPMLQKASGAQKRVYAEMLEQLQAAGVKGADQLQPNDFYVNRVWSHDGIRRAIDTHGADAVYDLLATAINVPGLIGDKAKAKRFLDTVRRLEFSKVMQNIHLYAEDMGTLRGELSKAGLAPDEVDLIVDTMFHAREAANSDKGRAAPMKYRFDINETLSANTPAGVLRIADLFENDSRVLVDTYLNTMAGHIGLAKHGIHSEAEFLARVKAAQDEALTKNVNIDDDVRLLQDVYSNVVGRPMSTQDFSKTARVAAALRGYSRSVNLGQLGLTAAFEMKQAVGLMGFRAFWQQMPTFRQFVTGLRNGYYPDIELARDLEHMVGFGHEMSSSYARAQEIDDGFLGQQLARVEGFANKASHAVDIISGNASMTSLTRQFSSMMATQRLYDFAAGRKALDAKLRERLVGWGVDDHQIEPVLDSFKRHTKARAGDGKVEEIDWETWLRDEPAQYHAFQTVVSRMVRDAIQDQDLGETMPFMHSTLGKVFGELKTFFLVAHAKNMLKNLHYRDSTALQLLLISWMGEMLAYSTQASVNYAHDPNKRAEVLAPGNIALAAFFRSPVHGMLPFLTETGFQVATGGKSLVSPDMTANTGNRSFVPPALIALQRLYAAPSSAFGLVTGSENVTRQEGMNLWKTLPLSNMIGARNLGAWLTESLPQSENRRGQ